MITVYLSGAYSDNPTIRVLDAIRENDRLEAKFPGVVFMVPQAMFHWWDMISSKPYTRWMEYCLALLRGCQINHRTNWDLSPGADREMEQSRRDGQLFTSTDEQLESALSGLGWRRP